MLQIILRGRSAMKGERSAMLQTFSLGGRSAMLQIFRGKVCNVADLPGGGGSAMLQTFRGEGLQGGRSAIQHRSSSSELIHKETDPTCLPVATASYGPSLFVNFTSLSSYPEFIQKEKLIQSDYLLPHQLGFIISLYRISKS